MNAEQIRELLESFEKASYNLEGVECWSARELQVILGYREWRNFSNAIEKAKVSCEKSGNQPNYHFVDINKTIDMPKGATKEIKDVALTRYACYLIAQNGDSSKPAIAFAQTYFAVQTRKQEVIERRLLDIARVTAREKLTKSEKKLSGIIYERGVDHKGFAIIRSKGDSALFGGRSTQSMKARLNVPEKRPLADFLPTLTIKAKDFAAELTSHNVTEKDLHGNKSIENEHIDNNLAVRGMLKERGVVPENLPPAEDVKKVKRRIEGENNKVEKQSPKLKKK